MTPAFWGKPSFEKDLISTNKLVQEESVEDEEIV